MGMILFISGVVGNAAISLCEVTLCMVGDIRRTVQRSGHLGDIRRTVQRSGHLLSSQRYVMSDPPSVHKADFSSLHRHALTQVYILQCYLIVTT